MGKPNIALICTTGLTDFALTRMQPGKGRQGIWFGNWVRRNRNAIWYQQAVAVAPSSDPNCVSCFTGLYPDQTGVYQQVGRDDELPELRFIQDILKEKGYTIVSAGGGCRQYFLRQADFSWWADGETDRKWRRRQNQIGLRAWNLVDPIDGPWFLFVRTMFQTPPYVEGEYFPKKGAKGNSVTALNEQLKFLLERLMARKDDTLVWVVSDCGDLGGVNKSYVVDSKVPIDHRQNLLEPLVHVPTVLWSKKLRSRTVSTVVQPAVDFLPTVFQYAGWKADKELTGFNMLDQHVLSGHARRFAFLAGVEEGNPKGWQCRGVRRRGGAIYRVLSPPGDAGEPVEEERGLSRKAGRMLLRQWVGQVKSAHGEVIARRETLGSCERLDEWLLEAE